MDLVGIGCSDCMAAADVVVVVVGSVVVVQVQGGRLQSVKRQEEWRRSDGTIVVAVMVVGIVAVGKGVAAVGNGLAGSEVGAAVAAEVSVVGMRVGERRWRAFSGGVLAEK